MTSFKSNGPTTSTNRPGLVRRQSSVTFRSQADLPRLPIPTLEETLTKFPKVVSALQTKAQQNETLSILKKSKPELEKLQHLLQEYEQEGRNSGRIGSYVEEFWNDSYLAPDQSVVLNLNPFFVLEDGPDAKIAKNQIQRAASLALASVKLASLLKHESLKPDVFRGQPLCMDQFKALFGTCRLPHTDHKDRVAVFPESTHVAVLCRNQLYYFQALWPHDGTVAVDESDIMEILRAIQHNAAETDLQDTQALGVLTSLVRNEWAAARTELSSASETNRESLQIIDSALFVLVLDDFVPPHVNLAAANMLHGTYELQSSSELQDVQVGTCCNRWYDKLQIIVCADGTTGVNFEHSAIDGHTALRFVSDVFAETVVRFAQSITELIYSGDRIPSVISASVKRAATTDLDSKGHCRLDVHPKKLVFEVPPPVVERIRFAETALGDQIISTDTVVLEFKTYGKLLIVANKMSPDSFVQMSMLLAYYCLYGKIVCTYEPVLTKQFFHGRTEAMRTATPEAAELCRMWTKGSSNNAEKLLALRKAVQEHSRLVKESAAGKGVDRHLFALKCIAQRNEIPVPDFFSSPPWTMLNHTVLSTSNCGNPALRLFGFGPVVQDGFGIGYIIKDNGLQYSVSSKHRQTQRYVHMLEKTLLDMQKLMTPVQSIKVMRHASTHEEECLPDNKEPTSSEKSVVVVEDNGEDAYCSIYGESEQDDREIAQRALGYFSSVVPHTRIRNLSVGIDLELSQSED